jgi:Na+/proline symporter
MLGWPAWQTILWCTAISLALTVSAGLWGVVVTDLLQFIVAMTGAFVAAYYAVHNDTVGGLSGLLSKLGQTGKLDMIPDLGNTEVALSVLIIPLVIQWWSTWYPGAEPGGGSYIAQRMLAAKNEKHSMGAVLWFNVAHYALRPWPWIIVGLASLVVYPQLSDIQAAFPQVSEKLIGHDIAYPAMLKFMPAGMLGLMLGSLMAAYFSTMSTHLNWGASYLVHDFYQRFIKTNGSQKHYVLVSRIVTTALMLLAALTVPLLTSAKDSFDLMLSIGAGTGLIYLLRWFWWRINAWSEVAAMISSFTISLVLFFGKKYELGGMERLSTHLTLAASVGFTSLVWIAVTLLTRPTEHGVLVRFYRLTRPFGPGWRHIQRETGLPASPDSVPQAMLGWVLSVMMVYAAMFGTGNFIYGNLTMGIVFSAVFLASAIGVGVILGRVFSKPLIEDEQTVAQ